jgi:DNA-directed RNA polymerase subunit RPC12/RpoP
MPSLACWSCGRKIFTTVPFEALYTDERRCPRCGATLSLERRVAQRRRVHQRQNPPDEPGPPDGEERRGLDRRVGQRRRPEG